LTIPVSDLTQNNKKIILLFFNHYVSRQQTGTDADAELYGNKHSPNLIRSQFPCECSFFFVIVAPKYLKLNTI
jgi:hypothetical protein